MLFFLYFINAKAQNSVELSLNINKNDTFYYAETYNAETLQFINGKNNKVSNNINSYYTLNVINATADSLFEIGLTFNKIITKTKLDENQLIINTDSVSEMKTEAEALYNSLINKSFVYLVDKYYCVKNSYAYNNKLNSIIDSIQIDKSRIKSYQTFFDYNNPLLKHKVIKPASKIIIKDSVYSIYDSLKIDIFNFTDIQQTCDNISLKQSSFNSYSNVFTDKNVANEINGLHIYYDTKGKSESSFVINNKTGIVVEYKSKLIVKGNVIIKYSKKGLPAYIWPITINVENNYILEESNNLDLN